MLSIMIITLGIKVLIYLFTLYSLNLPNYDSGFSRENLYYL